MNKPMRQTNERKRELLTLCVRALDDKKAEKIRILDVSEISSITDYLVIASGTSEPHLRALGQEVSRTLKENKQSMVGHELNPQSGWTVLDAHDVIVHIFLPEKRELYQLDALWKDGHAIDLSEFVEIPEPAGRGKR